LPSRSQLALFEILRGLRYVPGVAHVRKDLVKTHTLLERQLEAKQGMQEHLKWD